MDREVWQLPVWRVGIGTPAIFKAINIIIPSSHLEDLESGAGQRWCTQGKLLYVVAEVKPPSCIVRRGSEGVKYAGAGTSMAAVTAGLKCSGFIYSFKVFPQFCTRGLRWPGNPALPIDSFSPWRELQFPLPSSSLAPREAAVSVASVTKRLCCTGSQLGHGSEARDTKQSIFETRECKCPPVPAAGTSGWSWLGRAAGVMAGDSVAEHLGVPGAGGGTLRPLHFPSHPWELLPTSSPNFVLLWDWGLQGTCSAEVMQVNLP